MADPAKGAIQVEDRGGMFRVESSQLAVPHEQYDADYAWVSEREGAISLFFAKGDPGREDLVSRVEIRYAYETFVGHYWMASREFHELLQKQFRRSALMQRSDRQRRRPEAASPIKQHSLWANLNVISRAGTAASLDFYHLAPASLHRYTATRDRSRLDISPVLRVNTTVFEVLRLLDSSEPLVKELEPLLASMGLSASPLEESQK